MRYSHSLSRQLGLALLSTTALGSVAIAAPATEDGAKAMEKSFSPLIGTSAFEKKVVTIAPLADGYQISFDAEKLVSLLSSSKVEFKMAPMVLLATPQADGLWNVKADALPPLSFKTTLPDGGLEEAIKANNYKFEGTFDPKLQAYTKATSSYDSMDIVLGGKTPGLAKFGAGTFDLTGKDAGKGAVDTKIHHVMKDFSESVKMPPSGKDPAGDVTIKAAEMIGDSNIDGGRNSAMVDLWSTVLANPSHDEMVKHQDEIKAKITAALPFWNVLSGTGTVNNVSVTTQLGTFGAKTFSESMSLSGFTEKGALEFGFNFTDLVLPAGLVPAANAPLVPSSMDLKLKLAVNGFDRMAKTMIEQADFNSKDVLPENTWAELAGIAMTGAPTLTISPSHIVGPSMDIAIAGEVTLNGLDPAGKVTVDAQGIDKTIAAIKEASKNDPKAQSTIAGLTFLRGMAKPGANGGSTWVIEIQGKKVIVNGLAIPLPGK